MTRTLSDVIASLPATRRQRVEARFLKLKDEVESLGELRRMAGTAQAEIASVLEIKQPSVSKIKTPPTTRTRATAAPKKAPRLPGRAE